MYRHVQLNTHYLQYAKRCVNVQNLHRVLRNTMTPSFIMIILVTGLRNHLPTCLRTDACPMGTIKSTEPLAGPTLKLCHCLIPQDLKDAIDRKICTSTRLYTIGCLYNSSSNSVCQRLTKHQMKLFTIG